MATILIKKREGSGAPGAGDLTNSASGTEIAISLTDERIYTKSSAGSVIELGTNPSELDVQGTTHVDEVAEAVNIRTSTAASGTITIDWLDGGVVHMGTATSNFGLDIRGASGVSLNSVLATGEAAGVAVLIPQGASGYSQTFVSIDGATATPYWQGGATGTFKASGIDVIGLEVIKLGSASYTVLESVTQFKK